MGCLFTCSIRSILKIAHLLVQRKSEQAPLQIVNPTLLSSMESNGLLPLETADAFPLRFASTLRNVPGPATEPLCRHTDNGKSFTSFSEISFPGTALSGQACHANLRSWCSNGILWWFNCGQQESSSRCSHHRVNPGKVAMYAKRPAVQIALWATSKRVAKMD